METAKNGGRLTQRNFRPRGIVLNEGGPALRIQRHRQDPLRPEVADLLFRLG